MPDEAAAMTGKFVLSTYQALFGVLAFVANSALSILGYRAVDERFGPSRSFPCPLNGRLEAVGQLNETMKRLADRMDSFCTTVERDHHELAANQAAAAKTSEIRSTETGVVQQQILTIQQQQIALMQSHGNILSVLADRGAK